MSTEQATKNFPQNHPHKSVFSLKKENLFFFDTRNLFQHHKSCPAPSVLYSPVSGSVSGMVVLQNNERRAEHQLRGNPYPRE